MDSFSREIIERIRNEGVECLYHFTDIRNLPSVIQLGGLQARFWLEKAGHIHFVHCGGNELSHQLNGRYGNQNYVALAWWPRIPMLRRVQYMRHVCYLKVRPEICGLPGVLFTDENATSNTHSRKEGIEGLSLVDFTILKRKKWSTYEKEDFKRKQSEILVPGQVPLQYIMRIACISEGSRRETQRLMAPYRVGIPVCVEQNLFYPNMPFLIDYRVTMGHVTSGEVEALFTMPVSILQGLPRGYPFSFVAWIDIQPATRTTFIIKDRKGTIMKQESSYFRFGGRWFEYHHAFTQEGTIVEYWINDVPWVIGLPIMA